MWPKTIGIGYHIGFDIIAIIRACFKLLISNKKEGASTIEQQLIRVVTNDYRYTLK
ncbi:transglycosylase domain-containing protein [Bacteroides ovatus]|uniref:transglycosylase domain-containing protein n=1 Tax=Bacteroides ovatus TaxID=28116 RepID=UPI0032EFAF2C